MPVPAKGWGPWLLLLIVLTTALLFMQMSTENRGEDLDYTKFVQEVKNGQIRKCEFIKESPGIVCIRGEYPSDTIKAEEEPKKFNVRTSQEVADTRTKDLLDKYNVEYSWLKTEERILETILANALPVLLVFGLIYFLFMRQIRAAGHGALGFGKSRARLLNKDTNKVTFKNVAGIDEAKEEVEEIIQFLKDPKKFQKLGGRIPKGVMLMGPPGTGKTLLAKAIAGEAEVPFFSISGSDFVEMFVGVGASRVRDMFEQGKKNAPCIIFIDEIDAVGRSRFTGIGGGHDEREQTLNAILVEMDGFQTQEGVIIIAATNRPDVLDPALLRKGRFDRQIVIDLPLIDGREAILKIHSEKIKLADNVSLRRIARGTPGFSGADLENLLNESALLAARSEKKAVQMTDLEEARDKVMWGRERRSRAIDDKEKKLLAYHESGHALVQQVMAETEPLHKVTIIPRGVAYLGATMSLPEKDRYTQNRKRLLGELAGMMGGRAAEEIIFGDITNGSAQDIKQATEIAHLMVCNWGMSEEIGPQKLGENQELMFLGREVSRTQNYSEATAKKIDEEIYKLLKSSHEKATEILLKYREQLEIIAQRLLDRETIDGRDVEEMVEHGRVLSSEERDKIDQEKEAEDGERKSEGEMVETEVVDDAVAPVADDKADTA